MSSIDGVWNATMNTPLGARQVTLTLASDGGTLTGTMAADEGTIEIKDGTVDGDSSSWKADITNPMPLTPQFAATVDGDEITGNVKLGGFGNASFTGTRTS